MKVGKYINRETDKHSFGCINHGEVDIKMSATCNNWNMPSIQIHPKSTTLSNSDSSIIESFQTKNKFKKTLMKEKTHLPFMIWPWVSLL